MRTQVIAEVFVHSRPSCCLRQRRQPVTLLSPRKSTRSSCICSYSGILLAFAPSSASFIDGVQPYSYSHCQDAKGATGNLAGDKSKLRLLCGLSKVPEHLLAPTLNLIAHELARSLMVALLECVNEITLSSTCLPHDFGRQQLRIVTWCIKDLPDGAVLVNDFRQQHTSDLKKRCGSAKKWISGTPSMNHSDLLKSPFAPRK